MTRQQRFLTIVILAGVALLAGSAIWPGIAGGRRAWDDEQQKSWTASAMELKRLRYEATLAAGQEARRPDGNGSIAPLVRTHLKPLIETTDPGSVSADRLSTQLAGAEQRYRELSVQLAQAKNAGQGVAACMRWLGIALAAAGAVGLALVRSPNPV